MNIVVTGSIAFDYLMSFPGKFTEHFLPEHMHRVSLSFLVDTMDKRRGGCAPNIAYTLALLGERPLLMATAGRGLRRLPAVARGGRRRHVARASRSPASSARRSSAAPISDNNQIASFYTGAMADAGELSFRTVDGLRAGDHLAERSRRRWCSTPRSAARSASRSSSIRASSARGCRATSCATASSARPSSSATTTSSSCSGRRPGSSEDDILDAGRDADRHARRARLVDHHDGRRRSTCRP